MSEPRTEAGKRLDLAWPGSHIDRLDWRDRIVAIEAEAATLDAERAAQGGLREAALAVIRSADAHEVGLPSDESLNALRAALAAQPTPTLDAAVCDFPGCGLPRSLHGAPPGEPPNPTRSTHRFLSNAAGEPELSPLYPLLAWAEAVRGHHRMLRTEPPFTTTAKLDEALDAAYAVARLSNVTAPEPTLDA